MSKQRTKTHYANANTATGPIEWGGGSLYLYLKVSENLGEFSTVFLMEIANSSRISLTRKSAYKKFDIQAFLFFSFK